MTEQKPYVLYAVKTNAIKPEELQGYEYALIPVCGGGRYALVFTDKELKEPYVRIPDETALTDEERRFVTACKIAVNRKYLDENADEITPILENFADELQKALSEEAEKLKGEQPK